MIPRTSVSNPESRGADEAEADELPSRPTGDDWAEVRDSWMGSPPVEASEPQIVIHAHSADRPVPKSDPAPLAARLPAARPEPGARLELATSLFEAGDAWGALLAVEGILERDPRIEVLALGDRCRDRLEKLYGARMGDLARIPHLVARGAGLPATSLDASTGLVLAQIDGVRSVDAIARSGVVPRLETLRLLSQLWLRGVVSLD